MKRRAFVGTLLASLGGLVLEPEGLLWRPAEGSLPRLEPSALVALPAITRVLLEAIAARLPACPELARVPEWVEGGSTFGVDLRVPEELSEHGLRPEAWVDPVASAMAAEIVDRRVQWIVPLWDPGGVCASCRVDDAGCGLSLRALAASWLEPASGEWVPMVRFEMGGYV